MKHRKLTAQEHHIRAIIRSDKGFLMMAAPVFRWCANAIALLWFALFALAVARPGAEEAVVLLLVAAPVVLLLWLAGRLMPRLAQWAKDTYPK
jgi:hypothetical protein